MCTPRRIAIGIVVMELWAAGARAQAPAPLPPVGKSAPALPGASTLPGDAKRPAAVVNGEVITVGEVKTVLEQRPSPVALSDKQQREMRQAVLDMLIEDALMRQFLRKNVAAPTTADVNQELGKVQAFLKKKGMTLAEYLRQEGQTQEQLLAHIATRIQWKQYLIQQVPESVAKQYYDVNKVHFDQVLVQASHILVRAGSAPEERKVAQTKLEAIRQELAGGKLDFADAARRYSDCTASKASGGDIGWFPYKFVVVDPIARAAFSMKVGEVSDIIQTEFGLHLLKVTDRKNGEPSHYDTIKETVREVYAQDHEIYQRIIVDQRRTAKIEVFLQ